MYKVLDIKIRPPCALVGICVEGRCLGSGRAVVEHIGRIRLAHIPIGEIQIVQILAAAEHPAHIGDLGSVKAGDVQFGQTAAASEHIGHVGDIGGIEAGEIQFGQTAAATEHVVHVGDIGGVEAGDVQFGQAAAAVEHVGHGGNIGGIQTAQIQRYKVCTIIALEHVAEHRGGESNLLTVNRDIRFV